MEMQKNNNNNNYMYKEMTTTYLKTAVQDSLSKLIMYVVPGASTCNITALVYSTNCCFVKMEINDICKMLIILFVLI